MRFDLVRPCPNCPFRRDCLKEWLGEARATEIADSVLDEDRTFACHETTQFSDDDGEYAPHEDEQHCVGAIMLVEQTGAANAMIQIAERLGLLHFGRFAANIASQVFATREDFIAHHASRKAKS